MHTKTFIQKLFSRYLILNLLAMMVVVALVVAGISMSAAIYTHHGETVEVPDVTNKRFEDAEKILESAGLSVQVTDTGYNRLLPPGCILHQTPQPGEEVKEGRMVYISINGSRKPTLVVPDVIDNCSVREATARLKILGFKVGEPRYISGEKDWVYGVICRGRLLAAGERVPVDAMVVLQVGNGTLDEGGDFEFVDPDIEAADDASIAHTDSIVNTVVEDDPFQVVE